MTEEKAEWHASQMVALDAGKFLAMQQELEQLRAERNGHAITTLATQRKVAELEAENERLQGVLRMVDDWIASTLPGSSSEAIRALIAETLEGRK